MFDKRNRLQERLRPVVAALRGVRFWYLAAGIVVVATLIAWAMVDPVREGRFSGFLVALAILACVAVALVVVAISVRLSFRDPRTVALRIERRFPALQQRLLTAVGLAAPLTGVRLGYLQRRVIEEAENHGRSHRWVEAVPSKHRLLSRLTGLLSLAAMGLMLVHLADSGPLRQDGAAIASSRAEPKSVVIEPGNVEIERGTGLMITARFPSSDDLHDDFELICVAVDGTERRLPMKATLDDPVLSGFVSTVDTTLRYQVVSPRYESEVYTAEVFDFPALVRSDAVLEYPEYTAMESKRVEDTVRVTAVEGTRLQWNLRVNKPVAEAILVDDEGQRLTLSAAAGEPLSFTADFELMQTRRWRLELVDEAGRENKFPPELVARVLVNQPPSLKMVSGGDAEVSALEEFPVAVSVRDDFGVESFGVSYLTPRGEQVEVVLGEAIERGQTARGDFVLDFEALDAAADDLLTYYFWAEDRGPDGARRRVQGDLYFAEVRPFEAIYREDQSPDAGGGQNQPSSAGGGNGQQAEALAELQKQIINATWNVIRREIGDQRTATFADDLRALVDGQADAIGQLDELASRVTDEQALGFVERASDAMHDSAERLEESLGEAAVDSLPTALASQQLAYQALLGLRAREFQVSRSRQDQASGQPSAAQQRRQQQLDQLELQNDENRYETQSQAADDALDQAGEQREVIDRLRQLAQRQEDINRQVAELQSALELAESEEDRQEIRRQLKRLREQEQELLRDADELADRIQQQQSDAESTSERLEQTRENIRQASEALAREDAAEALAAGTRAERELDEAREELRQQAAGNFDEAMRQLRSAAQTLDDKQQQIGEQIGQQEIAAAGPGLRPEEDALDPVEELRGQSNRLGELMQRIEETVQEAESSEPLLAQNLYDSYRKTQQQRVEQKLEETAELLRRGFLPQAEQLQGDAAEAISELRERLERAAESVLGDQTKALQRALGELEQLQRELDREVAEATGGDPDRLAADPTGEGRSPAADDQAADDQAADDRRSVATPGDQQLDERQLDEQQPDERQPGDGQPREQQPGGEPSGERPSVERPSVERPAGGEQPSGEQPAGGEQPGGEPGVGEEPSGEQPGGGQPGQQAGDRGGMLDAFAPSAEPAGGQRGGGSGAAPLTGEGYRQWADRLRDVEQMIEDPRLRSEAMRIRERAREARSEFRRRSEVPQWDEVEETIATPLRELTRRVGEELLRRTADRHAVVPIDRDPVPDLYREAVRRYYESLGGGQ